MGWLRVLQQYYKQANMHLSVPIRFHCQIYLNQMFQICVFPCDFFKHLSLVLFALFSIILHMLQCFGHLEVCGQGHFVTCWRFHNDWTYSITSKMIKFSIHVFILNYFFLFNFDKNIKRVWKSLMDQDHIWYCCHIT